MAILAAGRVQEYFTRGASFVSAYSRGMVGWLHDWLVGGLDGCRLFR